MAEIEFIASTQAETAIEQDYAAPRGRPCDACGCPIESHDKFCPACGLPQVVEATVVADEPPLQKFFRCDGCGSEVATDPERRSYVCPFCDSTYVVEFSPEQSDRQPPEFIIGFAVTPQQAQQKFQSWISDNGWFRPGDLRAATIAEKQKGVYLPFWSFSMLAQSRWSATIGEYWYRTETYMAKDANGKTVMRTRRVQETEWWPLSGKHHHYYAGFLISGSRGLPQDQAERIKPFNLPALKRYEPYFLAGWLAEEYSIARDEALRLCQQEFYRREQQNIAAFMPGNTHRQLQVSTNFSNVNSDLCLLPVYVLSYRYRDKLYRFLVNGQTGKVAGDKPLSWKRIAATVAGVLIAVGILVLIGALISRYA